MKHISLAPDDVQKSGARNGYARREEYASLCGVSNGWGVWNSLK